MKKPLNLVAVIEDGFSLEPELEQETLLLHFSGNGDMDAVPTIGPYLKALHAEARAQGVREVVVDMHQLYFMNSSCFKAFVSWIDQVNRMGSKGYAIRVLSDPRRQWQRRSLEAMRRIAPDVVRVEAHSEVLP